VLFLKDFT